VELETLFAEHRDALFRYLARYTRDPDLAEDLVQETFLKLVVRPPRTATNMKGWLFTVATNLAKDARKTSRRRGELSRWAGEDPVLASSHADASGQVERLEEHQRIRAALDELSHKERSALLLRAEGFAHREIATALRTTTGSVGTLVARALAKLAKRFGLGEGDEVAP
jgi:RNA polymerase sigma factor (sigma-70 family)